MTDNTSRVKRTHITVRRFLNSMFPDGFFDIEFYRPVEDETLPADEKDQGISRRDVQVKSPTHPADVFGACSLLLAQSGGYSQFSVKSTSGGHAYGYALSKAEIEAARDLGKRWRLDLVKGEQPQDFEKRRADVLREVAGLWKKLSLGANGKLPVYDRSEKMSSHPIVWWSAAHQLMIAADEAAFGIVDFSTDGNEQGSYWRAVEEIRYVESYMTVEEAKNGTTTGSKYSPPVGSSLAPSLSRDMACVQAKRRTPMIGCTLRTLSNNLSLLPARGVVRTALYGNPHGGHRSMTERGLNVLLVPFPFHINANWFKPSDPTGYARLGAADDTRNSMFTLEQHWLTKKSDNGDIASLKNEFLLFIDALLEKAREDCDEVNALVLPEYALNWEVYSALSEHLRKNHKDVEFLVSGSSQNCKVEDHDQMDGNFAFSSYFFDSGVNNDRFAIDTSRPKHHRWCLDRSQIEDYALASALDPRRWWWEDIHIPEREVYFHNFKQNSIYSVMICEDLARSEPCHDLLRAVAPNLLFVLLLDGPQLPGRWPARYATVLAEDPGTSVLTLTSRGLIARSNSTGNYTPNWNVALWQDDKGPPRAITCGPNHQAVLLTLSGVTKEELSLDSRRTKSVAWRYNGSQPIGLDTKVYAELLKTLAALPQ